MLKTNQINSAETQQSETALHRDAMHESAWKHVTGRALFINDIPPLKGELVSQIYSSPIAHGTIKKLDVRAALAVPGVVDVLTAADIPGMNDVSAIYHDEEMLASSKVNFVGQAVALVVGTSYDACYKGVKAIECEYEEEEPIFDIADAAEKNSMHPGFHIIARGDLQKAFEESTLILEGEVESPGQEHWYLETHCAIANMNEDGDMKVICSTQNPTEVQAKVAEILDLNQSRVTVIMPRMGGGFGGKETQSSQFAGLACLAARKCRRPVRVWLNRDQDMMWTGKRHPFRSKYKAGFDENGMIKALEVYTYNNAGWAHDLSRSILDRCLFHLDSSYYIPNLHFEGRIAKTNLPSNTAFRGFGGPQGFIVTETVMNRAARALRLDPLEIRRRNYYGEAPRNVMQYGSILEDFRIPAMTEQIIERSRYYQRKEEINRFNLVTPFVKRGIGFQPVKFGISFTNTMLNQGGALVLIYADGSVKITHGGTEMGQGLHTKMIAIASHDLGVLPEKIRLADTATDKVPNSSATAASSGTDLNGAAIHDACIKLRKRLTEQAAKLLECDETSVNLVNGHAVCLDDGRQIEFEKVAKAAYVNRVQLMETGYYQTPGIGYDPVKGRGKPFAYYAYGVAVIEVEVSVLTGEYKLRNVDILHDVGNSIVPNIDKGQVEGAFVQGFGWLSCEELVWNKVGELVTHSPATYKIPTIGMVPDPQNFRVHLLENAGSDKAAIYGSKAVGEPPFVLAVGLITALEHAIQACGDPLKDPQLTLPATAENVLKAIYAQKS